MPHLSTPNINKMRISNKNISKKISRLSIVGAPSCNGLNFLDIERQLDDLNHASTLDIRPIERQLSTISRISPTTKMRVSDPRISKLSRISYREVDYENTTDLIDDYRLSNSRVLIRSLNRHASRTASKMLRTVTDLVTNPQGRRGGGIPRTDSSSGLTTGISLQVKQWKTIHEFESDEQQKYLVFASLKCRSIRIFYIAFEMRFHVFSKNNSL